MLNPEKQLTAKPKTVLDYFTVRFDEQCLMFTICFVVELYFVASGKRTVPELFYCFSLSSEYERIVESPVSPPVHELFLYLQELFKAVSSSKVGMDFILKVLFLRKGFLCGIFTYFLLIFTAIMLSR